MECINKCNNDTDKIFDDNLCRKCHKARLKHESYLRNKDNALKRGREWREKNIDKVKKRDLDYHEIHKEKRNQQAKEYYEKNREKIRAQRAQFHIDNPTIRKEQLKAYRENPDNKLELTLRRRARRCLIYGNRCMELLGCSIHFLKAWFKYLFPIIDSKMTLDNHGSYWEIDHVKPVSTFDLKNEEEAKACFNWKNVSPLEKTLNRRKNKYYKNEEIIEHQKRIESFMTYCKDNNITEDFNETLDTAGSS
jgi:hypothetical protein